MQCVQPFIADEAKILKVWPTLFARCTQKSMVMRRDSLALLTAHASHDAAGSYTDLQGEEEDDALFVTHTQ